MWCCSRRHELGGQVLLAGKPDWRRDLLGITDWLERECAHLGVDVSRNSYADEASIRALSPDVVFIATGGLPHTDRVEGDAGS